MSTLASLIQRGTRAAQPAATAVPVATLYFVTDESVTERSSGSAWQTFSPSAASGLVLLEARTASASASLDFTTRNAVGQSGATFQSDYDEYVIELVNVLPATDNVTFSSRFSTNGGSSYDSGSNYRYTYHYKNTAGGSGVVGSNSATSFEICGNLDSATAGGGLSGRYRVFNPLSATAHKFMAGEVGFLHNDTNYYRTDHGSWYVSITAVNAKQFFMSSGNIASGTIRIYGIKKT